MQLECLSSSFCSNSVLVSELRSWDERQHPPQGEPVGDSVDTAGVEEIWQTLCAPPEPQLAQKGQDCTPPCSWEQGPLSSPWSSHQPGHRALNPKRVAIS